MQISTSVGVFQTMRVLLGCTDDSLHYLGRPDRRLVPVIPALEFTTASVFLGQVFLDQDPDVGERRKLHDVGNDDRARQQPRPVRGGQRGRLLTQTSRY